jgi:hypothetical protein
MADQYIDELTALTTPDDADLVVIQDVDDGANGTTKKITVANLLAGAGGGGSSKNFILSDQSFSGTTWTDISGIGTINLDPSSTYVIRVKVFATLITAADSYDNFITLRYIMTQRSGSVVVRAETLPFNNFDAGIDLRSGYDQWTYYGSANADTQNVVFVVVNTAETLMSQIEATYIVSTSTGSPTFKLQANCIAGMDADILAGGWYEVTKVA